MSLQKLVINGNPIKFLKFEINNHFNQAVVLKLF